MFGAICRRGKEEEGIDGFLGLDSSEFRQHFRCTCHKKEKSASMYCLKYDGKDNAEKKKFKKNLEIFLYLEIFFEFLHAKHKTFP